MKVRRIEHVAIAVEDLDGMAAMLRDKLGIPMDRLNVNGGSIAIGHPVGMTGSRLVGTIDAVKRELGSGPERRVAEPGDVGGECGVF